MKEKIYRTCLVKQSEETYAICELHFVDNNYVVIVLQNGGDLFVDFNLEIYNNETPDIVIKYFEDECIDRFTCYGDFSLIEVKDNCDEEISFY